MRNRLPLIVLSLALALPGLLTACTLNEAPPTPVPTPDLPQVRFMFPQNNARIFDDTDITVDIVAEDATSGIARVEFLVDNVQINEGTPENGPVPVFRAAMNWVARGVGGHTLHAIAYRADGTRSDEQIILVEVIAR